MKTETKRERQRETERQDRERQRQTETETQMDIYASGTLSANKHFLLKVEPWHFIQASEQ